MDIDKDIEQIYKRLEQWDLTKENLRIDVFKKEIGDNVYSGVSVTMKDFEVAVSSYSERTQKGNLLKCLEISETILKNYML